MEAADYTAIRIKEMSPVELFTSLGLHKGQVGDYTMVRNPGTSRQQEHTFTYYFLGLSDFIGVDDTYCRRVFHRSMHFTGRQFFEQCDAMSISEPWQGPAESPRWTIQQGNRMRKNAKFALAVLRGEISIKPSFRKKGPKFKLKEKPRFIAHEDRPDVGAPLTKPKFKLKPKPSVQAELFEKPVKRRFSIRGRG